MRITAKFATAGESGFYSIPMIAHDVDHYLTIAGTLRHDEIAKDLGCTGVMMSSEDDDTVLAITLEFMNRLKIAMQRLMEKDGCVRNCVPGERATPAQRRMRRGKYTFVTIDLWRAKDNVRARVKTDNPYDVVGNAEEFAKLYAQGCMDNLVAVRDAMLEAYGGRVKLELVEGKNCEGMIAQAEERNRMLDMEEKYRDCQRRVNGYCSPVKCDCPLYKNGRCTYAEKFSQSPT